MAERRQGPIVEKHRSNDLAGHRGGPLFAPPSSIFKPLLGNVAHHIGLPEDHPPS